MTARSIVGKGRLLLGQCVPCVKENAVKIKIKSLELQPFLLMYYRKDDFLFAHNPNKNCKVGDVVLVRELPEKLTKLITHEVLRVVYPLGDIIDPISGRKCFGAQYRDDEDRRAELYGELPSRFKYEKAPERGWQEGKKDRTDAETYNLYHGDGSDQKYAV